MRATAAAYNLADGRRSFGSQQSLTWWMAGDALQVHDRLPTRAGIEPQSPPPGDHQDTARLRFEGSYRTRAHHRREVSGSMVSGEGCLRLQPGLIAKRSISFSQSSRR